MAFYSSFLDTFKSTNVVANNIPKVEPPKVLIPQTKDVGQFPELSFGGCGVFFPTSGSGVNVTPISSLQSAAVISCVNVITNDISKLPIRFEKRGENGGWIPELDHPVASLIVKPNRRMVISYFLQNFILHYLTTGNGLAVVIRAANGQAEELIPVYGSASIMENPNDGSKTFTVTSNLLIGKRTSVPGEEGPTRIISEDDMVHLMGLSLNNGISGQSAFTLASEVFGLALAAQETAARTFNNGSTTPGYLTTTAPLNAEVAKNWAETWIRATSGVANAGSVPVMGQGMEFKPMGLTPEVSQLLETRKFMTEEVARTFRVPPHKLGLLDGAKYNNIEQQNQSYIDETLSNITVPLEQVLNDVLLLTSEKTRYRIVFDYTEMKQSDTQTRWATYQIGLNNGFITPAYVAQREGLPIPTGAAATEYRRPLNTGTSGDKDGLPLSDGDNAKDTQS